MQMEMHTPGLKDVLAISIGPINLLVMLPAPSISNQELGTM